MMLWEESESAAYWKQADHEALANNIRGYDDGRHCSQHQWPDFALPFLLVRVTDQIPRKRRLLGCFRCGTWISPKSYSLEA